MAESTPRFSISYPTEHEQPFYSSFEQGILAIDSLLFADFERGNVIGFGGGTITWDSGDSNELSFTEDIVFASPTFGQLLTWAASESPIEIDPGHFLVFALTRGSTTAVSLTSGGGSPSVITTSSVPISGQSQVIAYHDPATGNLIFFNGILLEDSGGVTSNGLGQVPASGSFAPTNGQYLTLALSASLTAERQFNPLSPLQGTDNGINSTYDLGLVSGTVPEQTDVQTTTDTPDTSTVALASAADDAIHEVEALVIGKTTDGGGGEVFSKLLGIYKRDGGGNIALVDDIDVIARNYGSLSGASPDVRALLITSGADEVQVQLQGKAAVTIEWQIRYRSRSRAG